MAIIKKKEKRIKPVCGFIVNEAVYNLYLAVPNRARAEEIIKESFNIDPNRLISFTQPITNDNKIVTVLVLFDKKIKANERIKYLPDLEISALNFPILKYDVEFMDDLEAILERLESNQ